MTQEEQQNFNDLELRIVALEKVSNDFLTLKDIFYRFVFIDKYVFEQPVFINQGFNIKDGSVVSTGSNIGIKIGASATEKIGFFGVTPVVQQSAISAPSGGATVDSQSRTAITSIINELHALGLIA